MRIVIGPTSSFKRSKGVADPIPSPIPPEPAAPVKADPAVTIVALDPAAETVTYHVEPYDLATSNTLVKSSAYLVPDGVAIPTDGLVLTHPENGYAFTDFDTSAMQLGADFTVSLPDGPDGLFNLVTALYYDV